MGLLINAQLSLSRGSSENWIHILSLFHDTFGTSAGRLKVHGRFSGWSMESSEGLLTYKSNSWYWLWAEIFTAALGWNTYTWSIPVSWASTTWMNSKSEYFEKNREPGRFTAIHNLVSEVMYVLALFSLRPSHVPCKFKGRRNWFHRWESGKFMEKHVRAKILLSPFL